MCYLSINVLDHISGFAWIVGNILMGIVVHNGDLMKWLKATFRGGEGIATQQFRTTLMVHNHQLF